MYLEAIRAKGYTGHAQFLNQASKAKVTKAKSIAVSSEPCLPHFVLDSTVFCVTFIVIPFRHDYVIILFTSFCFSHTGGGAGRGLSSRHAFNEEINVEHDPRSQRCCPEDGRCVDRWCSVPSGRAS